MFAHLEVLSHSYVQHKMLKKYHMSHLVILILIHVMMLCLPGKGSVHQMAELLVQENWRRWSCGEQRPTH